MKLDTAAMIAHDLITQEQQASAIHGIEDLHAHQRRRITVREQLHILEQEVRTLREQVKALPALPPTAVIQWAQTVLFLLG